MNTALFSFGEKVEQSELAKEESVKDLLAAQLGKAYRFHSLCMAPIKGIQEQFTHLSYQPRDYLDYQVINALHQSVKCNGIVVEIAMFFHNVADVHDSSHFHSFVHVVSTSSGMWEVSVIHCYMLAPINRITV